MFKFKDDDKVRPTEWLDLKDSLNSAVEQYILKNHFLFRTAAELPLEAEPAISGMTIPGIIEDEILDTSEDARPPNFVVEIDGPCTLSPADATTLARINGMLFEQTQISAPQPFDYPEDEESRERAARARLLEYKKGLRDLLYGTTSE